MQELAKQKCSDQVTNLTDTVLIASVGLSHPRLLPFEMYCMYSNYAFCITVESLKVIVLSTRGLISNYQ